MELILWRHADAEDGASDNERRLTSKGVKQAARVAKWLRPRIPENAVVLASPAKRAQQTARALAPEFTTVKEIGTAAEAEDILIAAGWPKGDRTVVVVGHQPTLGETAALLLAGTKEQWSLKKGAVVWIARRADDKDSRTHLRALISPDLL
jgi:phosphohistidine phosphatase